MVEARSVPAVIQPPFYRAVVFSGSINLISSFLYNKSLQLAPLSSSVPYLSFTPVFLVGTSFILLGETPSLLGFMGTICVTTGGYFLHRQDISHLKTSEQKLKNKRASHIGSMMMLVVAALWSISSAYDKVGVANSTQLIYGTAIQSIVALGSLVARQMHKKKQNQSLPEVNTPSVMNRDQSTNITWKRLLILSLAIHSLVSYYLHLLATANANVSYVIAIKRAGCICSVIFGRVLFNEVNAHKKLPSILLMVFGVVCIVFRG